MPMKSLPEWQAAIKAAADRRYPTCDWDNLRRIQSTQDQLDDVKAALEVEAGLRTSDDHAHQDADHRIGALIADILILAEERGTDVEAELEKVLAWFDESR
jgi:hypothetical protein